MVTEDVHFPWDGVSQRLGRGTVLDVVPGSPLEDAIGAGNLRPLHAVAAQPAAAEPPAGVTDPPDAPSESEPKPKARARTGTGADTSGTTAPDGGAGGDPP